MCKRVYLTAKEAEMECRKHGTQKDLPEKWKLIIFHG